jgi:hypothetical protein
LTLEGPARTTRGVPAWREMTGPALGRTGRVIPEVLTYGRWRIPVGTPFVCMQCGGQSMMQMNVGSGDHLQRRNMYG